MSYSQKNHAVFLDRDGVINQMVYNADFGLVDSPGNPEEFSLLPGVSEAIARINGLGFMVVVVSNQPGIAKGRFNQGLLDAMTAKMIDAIKAGCGRIDSVYYCLHHPNAELSEYRLNCECRKPKPGLLLQAAKELEIDLAASYMVGDGITDVLAGQAAGTRTVLINSRKCYVCDVLSRHDALPDIFATSLGDAVTTLESLFAGNALPIEQFALPGRRIQSLVGEGS